MSRREPDQVAAERAAMRLRQKLSLGENVVDPEVVAQQLDIVVQGRADLDGSFSGCLMLEGSQFGILYSTVVPSEGYRRFTISHELGHHQIPGHLAALLDGGGRHLSQSGFSSHGWYEIEADAFAAAFLMPEERFGRELLRLDAGLPAVKGLASIFQTSYTSTAIRYARLSPDPVAVIVSRRGQVDFCFVSSVFKQVGGVYISKGSPVPRLSVTAAMGPSDVEAAADAQGTSRLSEWFEAPAMDLEMNEDVVGLGRYGKVLTILHASELPDEDDHDSDDDGFTPDGKRYRW